MKIYDRFVKEKIDIEEDLILCVNNIVFEQSIKCKNIRCENGKKSFKIKGYMNAGDIDAGDIDAWNINACNINARDIDARNIIAKNINVRNIDAMNINARNIIAKNINAYDINAMNINASDIVFWGVCFAYENIKCNLIKGTRKNFKHFVLDGKLEYKTKRKLEDLSKDELIKRIKELEGKIK